MYSAKSVRDKRTLFQIIQVLYRTSVKDDPGKDLKAAEDFFQLAFESHLVAAALHTADDCTSDNMPSLKDVADSLVERFFPPVLAGQQTLENSDDGVFSYAKELISLGLVYHGFHNAIREGDGNRIRTY